MKVNWVRVYDENNVLIKSWEGGLELDGSEIKYGLFDIPSGAYYVQYSINHNGTDYIYNKYNLGGTTGQYFYFNDKYVDTVYFKGKKDNIVETDKKTISNGKKINVVQIKYTNKVKQNTGLNLTDKQIYDLGSTPFIFEVDGETINNYILDNNSVEGYNTKSFGNKNTVLTLTNTKTEERYTSSQNNFWN